MFTRRSFLASSAGGLAGAMAMSSASFAQAPTDNRLIVVFLRGGMDGLHALVPVGDANLRQLRPRLSETDGLISLDGYFSLHRGLGALMPLYQRGELSFLPAAATQYRERSHFDGQNLLENGSGAPYGSDSGWLNRAIVGLNGGDRRLGLSIGPALPLIMQGEARIQTWSETIFPEIDEDFMARLMDTYRHDALFLDSLHDANGTVDPSMAMDDLQGGSQQGRAFQTAARAAADLLARADGPRVAMLELGGWDTHFNQDSRLNQSFGFLARGLLDLQEGLGAAWSRTAVLVVSEFGRTAAENGNGGTDHGTGGLAMLAGGAVAGGQIAGLWPGLSERALFEGRDLRAINSYESLFKSVLIGHLGLDQAFVEDHVFPGSAAFAPMTGLLRTA